VYVLVPSHAGGLEITGPVGVIGLPQLSITVGGIGTTIELTQAAVAFVGGIGGKGLYSIVTV
jgi:hypothetical protein